MATITLELKNLFLLDYRLFNSVIVYREFLINKEYPHRDIRIYGVQYISVIPDFGNKIVNFFIKEGKFKNVYTFVCGKKKYIVIGTSHEIFYNNMRPEESGLKTLSYFDQAETIEMMTQHVEGLNKKMEEKDQEINRLKLNCRN